MDKLDTMVRRVFPPGLLCDARKVGRAVENGTIELSVTDAILFFKSREERQAHLHIRSHHEANIPYQATLVRVHPLHEEAFIRLAAFFGRFQAGR